jgi:hypothetical protein
MTSIAKIRKKYNSIKHSLNEKSRRLWCAAEALSIGRCGISMVHAATEISRPTIHAGIREINSAKKNSKTANSRIRKKGAGAKLTTEKTPEILRNLEKLVEPATKGHPESSLRWTNKGLRKLSTELCKQGFQASPNTVALLLRKLGYSLQLNRKEKEGKTVPDRNAQFEYINEKVMAFQRGEQPVISVDTKKKELIGNVSVKQAHLV